MAAVARQTAPRRRNSQVREQGDRRDLDRDGDRERSGRQQHRPRLGSVVGEHHQCDDQEMDVAEAQFLDDVSPDDQECDEEHLPSPLPDRPAWRPTVAPTYHAAASFSAKNARAASSSGSHPTGTNRNAIAGTYRNP